VNKQAHKEYVESAEHKNKETEKEIDGMMFCYFLIFAEGLSIKPA
jgi:hypothetical protein